MLFFMLPTIPYINNVLFVIFKESRYQTKPCKSTRIFSAHSLLPSFSSTCFMFLLVLLYTKIANLNKIFYENIILNAQFNLTLYYFHLFSCYYCICSYVDPVFFSLQKCLRCRI